MDPTLKDAIPAIETTWVAVAAVFGTRVLATLLFGAVLLGPLSSLTSQEGPLDRRGRVSARSAQPSSQIGRSSTDPPGPTGMRWARATASSRLGAWRR